MNCDICGRPQAQRHHIAKPTEGSIRLCGNCNRRQENHERHYGAFDHGATPLNALIEQLFSLQPTAEVDGTLIASLLALRTVLALASGERTGPRPISNRTTMPDDAPRRDPERLMRELLRAVAQSIEELGLEHEAKLARALSNAPLSEQFGEQARDLLALAPRMKEVFASAQTGDGEPDLALVGSFISRTRSLLAA